MRNDEKLNLDEIVEISKMIANTIDFSFTTELNIKNNKITIDKNANQIKIISDDGRELRVKIYYSKEETYDSYNNRKITYLDHSINTTYKLNSSDSLELNSKLSLNEGYESFNNIEKYNLLENCKLNYVKDNEKLATISLDFNKVNLKEHKKIKFNKDNIIEGNKVISKDGNRLMYLYDEKVNDSYINSFNSDLEKEKIKVSFLNSDLHPYSQEILEDSFKHLDDREMYASEVKDYYNREIKYIKKAIDIRDSVIDGVKNNQFSKEELSFILDVIGYYSALEIGNEKVLKLKRNVH